MEITIGLICTLLGAILGYAGFTRNRDKDVGARAAETAVMNTKLDSIGAGVDQIRMEQKASDVRMEGFNGRLIGVEKDVQSAKEGLLAVNKRVDKISGGDRA